MGTVSRISLLPLSYSNRWSRSAWEMGRAALAVRLSHVGSGPDFSRDRRFQWGRQTGFRDANGSDTQSRSVWEMA